MQKVQSVSASDSASRQDKRPFLILEKSRVRCQVSILQHFRQKEKSENGILAVALIQRDHAVEILKPDTQTFET